MSERPTLLGVFAHPDDESFGPGGTLARYAASGVDVHVVIGTDGDAGSIEEKHQRVDGQTLAQERQGELSRAAVALGITTIWSLPFRDSGMRGSPDNQHERALIRQPVENLIGEIQEYILRLRPQVILTHDPFGGYGHPDHIRLCEVVTAAFYQIRAGSNSGSSSPYAPQKLYYTAIDKRILRWAVRLMKLLGKDPRALGRNQDINLEEIAGWGGTISTAIDISTSLPRKTAASQAHASQFSGGPTFWRIFPNFIRQRLLETETFLRVYPPVSGSIERDLFHGVRLER